MFFFIYIIFIAFKINNQMTICNNFEFFNVIVKECMSCSHCNDLTSNDNCHGCCKPEFWFDTKVHDCHPCSECESFEDRRMCESQCRKNSNIIKCKKKEWFDSDNKFCQSCVKCDNPQTCAFDCFNSSDCADNHWYDVVSHACESCTDCELHSILCINQCTVQASTELPVNTKMTSEVQNHTHSHSGLILTDNPNASIVFSNDPMKMIFGIFIIILLAIVSFFKLAKRSKNKSNNIQVGALNNIRLDSLINNPGILTAIPDNSAMESNETTNTENDPLISDSRTGNSDETPNETIANPIVYNEAIQNQQEINRKFLNPLPRPIHPEITLSRNISDETQNEAIANPIVNNEDIQNQQEININNLNPLPRPIHPEITLSRNISDETQNENIQNHQERNNINLVSPMPRPIDPESTPIRNNSVIAHPTNDQNSARFYNTRTIL